jgi:hypothetical protein
MVRKSIKAFENKIKDLFFWALNVRCNVEKI